MPPPFQRYATARGHAGAGVPARGQAGCWRARPWAAGVPTWRATRSATTCPWAGWVLACPTVGRWRAYLACHQIGHHLPVAMPVLTCHQIKRTTCPWA